METEKQKITGTWKLISFELINKSAGKIFYPYGKNPVGTLIVSSDNYMSVAVMADNRENFSTESIQTASEVEKARAMETYLSYSGTWKIIDDKIFVSVMVSLLPNWTNKEHYRYFQIDNDKLTFQTPPIKQGEREMYIELSWTRI